MLCLIRHGETVANQAGLYAGLTEYELTPTGKSQAVRIGEYILSVYPDNLVIDKSIISSPIGRAHQTAIIISKLLPEADVITDNRIREVDYGFLDGTPIRKGISFIDEAQIVGGGVYGVEPVLNIQRRASDFLKDNEQHLDPKSSKIKLAVGHGALWSVVSALAQSHPLASAKIQKNYEIILLTSNGGQVIDTRK
jgi:broad specificity phosphatase PhoE